MLTKQQGNIDWTKPAVEIERLIRGLNPWPSAYTKLDNKTLKIWTADVIADTEYENQNAVCGQVVFVDKSHFIVKTGDGYLAVEELQLEGKKRMLTDAFLRGYKVTTDTILGA